MTNLRKILGSMAALGATLSLGAAHAAVTTAGAEADTKKFNVCMAMSEDALAQDTDCADLMKRRNITVADMQAMKTCKSMKADTMAKDETCAAITSKYPDVMRPTPQ